MPSIHAILLVALGGVLGADPRDDPARDRPGVEDPFSAPADYRRCHSQAASAVGWRQFTRHGPFASAAAARGLWTGRP